MKVILGASGKVGSAVVKNLCHANIPVTGVVRSPEKGAAISKEKAVVAVGDAMDLEFLRSVFVNADTVLLITPETGKSENVIGDTQALLTNYRRALENSSVRKIVGLSSMGAQYDRDSGNLLMSHLLEHAFEGLPQEQVFVRPAYYFSNWLLYLKPAKETGLLSTFFPADLVLPMVAPSEVADLLAEIIAAPPSEDRLYEVEGPAAYSSEDVADAFTAVLGRTVVAQPTPRDQWAKTLSAIGFTEDAVKNFIEMTDLVVSRKPLLGQPRALRVRSNTTLTDFVRAAANKKQ